MKVYIHHHSTSKMFNFVRTTVYYTLVMCYHAQSKWQKGKIKKRESIHQLDTAATVYFTAHFCAATLRGWLLFQGTPISLESPLT